MLAHQNVEPVVGAPGFPVLVGEAEDRLAGRHTSHVESHRPGQVGFDFAEHLVGLPHLDGMPGEAEVIAERGDATDVHTGHRRRAEVHGYPVGFAMIQGREDPFPAGHVRPLAQAAMPLATSFRAI